ncbi:MAG: hypothetical protein R6U46_07455 [Marinilabilia sp.]
MEKNVPELLKVWRRKISFAETSAIEQGVQDKVTMSKCISILLSRMGEVGIQVEKEVVVSLKRRPFKPRSERTLSDQSVIQYVQQECFEKILFFC